VKQSLQDLVIVTGILAIISAMGIIFAGLPSQAETAKNIKTIVSNAKVVANNNR
jgi:hypothetical protein